MQSGNAASAHTRTLTFLWLTGDTLAEAIEDALAAFTPAQTWPLFFSPATSTLASPYLKMPKVTVKTAAADGVLTTPGAANGFPLTQNTDFTFNLDDTSQIEYTGASSAFVFLEC